MLKFVTFCALLSVALAVRVCFPQEFTVTMGTYSSQDDGYFMSEMFSSVEFQKERIDFFYMSENGQQIDEQITFIFDYQGGNWYEIDTFPQNKTEVCHVHTFNETHKEYCLSQTAQRTGSFYLGGSFQVDNYYETDGKGSSLDMMVAAGSEIPTRLYERKASGEHINTEFWNFRSRVHHDVFRIPSVCGNAIPAKSSEPVTRAVLRRN